MCLRKERKGKTLICYLLYVDTLLVFSHMISSISTKTQEVDVIILMLQMGNVRVREILDPKTYGRSGI